MPAPSNPSFREAQFAVDKDIVAYDVQRISAQQYPHGGLRICDSVRKLLEAVEQHHETSEASNTR